MNSPDQPPLCPDVAMHTTREMVEVLQNLLYLIGQDACDSCRVRAYVAYAEGILTNVQTPIF
jgi:hypothetical protein